VLRILVADDHPIVRRGLKQILSDQLPSVMIGEAGNAAATLQLFGRTNWDVVVLDISMPGRNGLEVLRDLKRLRSRVPVLVLSIHPEEQFAVRVVKAGAAGYLGKDSAPEELVEAIKTVLTGRKYLTPTVAEHLAFAVEADGRVARHELLSDREHHVLRSIAIGKTVSQIAAELSLSVKTISTYRTRLRRKMGLKTTAELIRYALQHHLVT